MEIYKSEYKRGQDDLICWINSILDNDKTFLEFNPFDGNCELITLFKRIKSLVDEMKQIDDVYDFGIAVGIDMVVEDLKRPKDKRHLSMKSESIRVKK